MTNSLVDTARSKVAPDLDLRPDSREAYLAQIVPGADPARRPNVLIVLFDDLGQGDLSSYGSKPIETPRMDALGAEGVMLDSFYASAPVCTPSRFGLLTGRYPTRGFVHSVFFPTSTPLGRALNAVGFPRGVRGILPDEITVADALRASGYRTGLFGKWHLGDQPDVWPTAKGFDEFFGSPYSNDMDPYEFWRDDTVEIPAPIDQSTLTARLTEEIATFVEADDDRPFFALYSSPFPHNPVHAGEEFRGTSQAGTYGDCVQELDASVGEILDRLEASGRRDDTLVIVTSDNGPWFEGSPGFHRGRKGNTFDGGQVVPFIASWPGHLASGLRSDVPAMNIDLFPTIADIVGIELPDDRVVDGRSMLPLLTGESDEPIHDELLFVKGRKVSGIRDDEGYKYFSRHRSENSVYSQLKQGPFLFRVTSDPDESYDLTAHEPERAAHLAQRLAQVRADHADNPRGWR